jgi:UDP-2,3-diacylglucosamine pyrophosphatase LpxH
MKNLFISDLHLGSPLFKSDNKIISLLDDKYDNIYIVGDIIDVWEDCSKFIIEDHKELILKINSLSNIKIVKGNHDPSIDKLKKIFPLSEISDCFSFKDYIFSCAIVHGDEFDKLVTKYSWLAKLLFPIHWILQRLGLNIKAFFRKLFYSVSSKRNKKYYTKLVSDIEKNLIKKYRLVYNYIVCGHTHFPKIVNINGFRYINCGDWIHNRTYVIYNEGEFTLMGENNNAIL